MNNITFNEFKNIESYKNFIEANQGSGNLIIRAYAANEAVPISNVNIIVSLELDNYNIVFFNGVTDESGMIPKITLPAPIYNENNLVAPLYTTYDIKANYKDKEYNYKVNLYDDICVVQTINIVPNLIERGNNYGN